MVTVDRSFLKDLKLLDKRLSTKFNGQNIVVTYDRGHGEPVNIHTVKSEDGSFRQPDTRDMMFIKSGDLEGSRMKDRLSRLASYCETAREKDRKNSREEILAMTRDSREQLKKAFLQATNSGKANSAFRRISP